MSVFTGLIYKHYNISNQLDKTRQWASTWRHTRVPDVIRRLAVHGSSRMINVRNSSISGNIGGSMEHTDAEARGRTYLYYVATLGSGVS